MVIICIFLFYIYNFGFPVSSRSLVVTPDEPLWLPTSYPLPTRRCPYRELHDDVLTQATGDSLGSQLKKATPAPSEEERIPHSKSLNTHVTPSGKLRLEPLREAGETQKANRRQQFTKEMDHIIMRLICVCGLVPNPIDSDEWKELMGKLNGSYKPSSADNFRDKIIPLEAAFVCKEQIGLLKQESNLTLTFDGTTIQKPELFYTAHATTPSRKSYFLDGHEDTGEHHNTEWIKSKLMKVSFCFFSNLMQSLTSMDQDN